MDKVEASVVPTVDALQAEGPRNGSVPHLTFASLPQRPAMMKALEVPVLSEEDKQVKEVMDVLDALHKERRQLQESLKTSRRSRQAAEARAAKAVAAGDEDLATLELVDVKRAVGAEEKVVHRYKQCSAQVDRWMQRVDELRTAKFDCQASRLLGDVNKSLQAQRMVAAQKYEEAEVELSEVPEYEVPTLSASDDAWIKERLKALQTKSGVAPEPVAVPAPVPEVPASVVARPSSGAFVPTPVFQHTAPAPQPTRVAFPE
jgi:hypothetical protein